MGTDESLAVSTMSRPTQGPSSSLEEFPQKIGVPLQEPKNKQPLNHLPQEPPKSWGKSWRTLRLAVRRARMLGFCKKFPTGPSIRGGDDGFPGNDGRGASPY